MDSTDKIERHDSQSNERATTDKVEIDITQLELIIRSTGIYEKENKFLIKPFTPVSLPSTTELTTDQSVSPTKYVAKIMSSFIYTGLLSSTLSKEQFGLNKYPQGDSYLGEWRNDLKEGLGMYHYASLAEQSVYVGNWVKGVKQGKGILFLLNTSPTPDNPSNVYIGSFNEDKFIEGITLSQTVNSETNEKERIVYIGKYNSKGEKEDSNGMLIQGNSVVLDCDLTNEKLRSGWMMELKEGAQIEKLFKFNKQQEDKIEYEKIEGKELEKHENIAAYIDLKQKYDVELLESRTQDYFLTVLKLEKQFESIEEFQLTTIEEAIKVFKDNQLAYDTIKKAQPLQF